MKWDVEARRFRPGLDYTLATSEEEEARLDVVLGLTPEVTTDADSVEGSTKKRRGEEEEVKGWQSGEWGGWECYMAPHEGEDDPAVYSSGPSRRKSAESETAHSAPRTNGNGKVTSTDAPGSSQEPSLNGKHKQTASTATSETEMETETETAATFDHEHGASGDEDAEADEEADEADGTLLTVQPGFNRLLLVLRDEKVMRFVKYVSAAAEGSRWDVCAEFEIGMIQEEEEEGEGKE